MIMWRERYASYRKEMSMSIAANDKEEYKNNAANEIILKYKQVWDFALNEEKKSDRLENKAFLMK